MPQPRMGPVFAYAKIGTEGTMFSIEITASIALNAGAYADNVVNVIIISFSILTAVPYPHAQIMGQGDYAPFVG